MATVSLEDAYATPPSGTVSFEEATGGDPLAAARKAAGPGASEAEVREAAARLQPKPPAPAPTPPPPEPPPPERSLPERFGRGLMMIPQGVNKGLANTFGGLGDLGNAVYHAIGQSDLPPGYFTRLAERLLVGEPGSPRRLEPENRTERTIEGASAGGAEAATMALGGTGLAALRTLPGAGPALGTFGDFVRAAPVMQVTSGAAGGGVTEATGDPNLGLAASLAVPGLAATGRRVVQPVQSQRTPEGRALVQDAENMGIPLSAGERTGSLPLQVIESTFERLPLTSGPQKEIKQAQQRAINSASLDASHTPGDVASPDVLRNRRADIGQDIGDIAGRNPLDLNAQVRNSAAPPPRPGQPAPTTDIVTELQNIGREAQLGAAQGGVTPVTNWVRDLLQHYQPNGTIDGSFVREWATKAAAHADRIRQSDPDLAHRLDQLVNTVRDGHATSMSPQDAADFARARRDYANLHVTIDAVAGAGEKAAEGQVPPKALRGAVVQSVGEVPYALGEGDQNRLARVGQSVVREPVGESGTSIRDYAIKLLTGAPLLGGATGGFMLGGGTGAAAGAGLGLVLPRLIQGAMNSGPGQAYLSRGIPGLRNLIPNNPSSMTGNMARALAARLLDEQQRRALGLTE